MNDWKLLFMSVGILAALGSHVWADYLTTPIRGKGASELSSEMVERIMSSISAILLGVFDKPYEIKEASYDIVWNLGVPLVLLIFATFIFGFIVWQLAVSIFRDENAKIMYVWKGILSLALIYVFVNSIIKLLGILVLNVVVAITVVIAFLFIGSIFKTIFNREEKETNYHKGSLSK